MNASENAAIFYLRRVSNVCGISTVALGLVGLFGDLFGVDPQPFLISQSIFMSPQSAIGFILLGTALCLLHTDAGWGRTAARVIAILMGALVVSRAFEMGGFPLRWDRWIFQALISRTNPQMKMSINALAAFNFLPLSVALFLLSDRRNPRAFRDAVQALTIGPAFVGFLFLFSDVSQVPLSLLGHSTGMSLMTSFAFMFLGTGEFLIALSWNLEEQRKGRRSALEDQYRLIADNSHDLICLVNPQATYLYLSPSYLRILGYTQEELLGTNVFSLVHPDDLENVKAHFEKTLLSRSGTTVEFRYKHKDGRWVYVETSGNWAYDDKGAPVTGVAVSRDITERRELEAESAQAQKMEGIGRLAGGVAHDFNNHLSVILGYTEILLAGSQPSEQIWQDVNEIKKAAERSADLTHQLLSFSRKQMLQPQVLSLDKDIHEMMSMVKRLTGEMIDLRFSPGPSVGLVKADPGQIQQVLMNLVVNARDAMNGKGKIAISVANADVTPQEAAQKDFPIQPGPYVAVAVQDNGSGMSDQVKSHIFEPFFTTKDKSKGTGLGLSTVYGIVKQSGGFISVESALGQGTTFTVYLPRLAGERLAPKEPAPVAVAEHGNGRILLVEDEKSVLDMVQRVLEKVGYTVLSANNPGEALLICEQDNSPIELLLSDMIMPHMNGDQLAKRLLRLHPEMKTLFMSGYYEADQVAPEIFDDGKAFLKKPFTPDALLQKIRSVIDIQKAA